MFMEKKFYYDIDNIKQDLAMEDMIVTEEHVENLRRYANNEISMDDIMNKIKKDAMERN